MKKRMYDFTILFDEMDKLRVEGSEGVNKEDVSEYDEINTLREIVIDVQTPTKICLITT